MNHIRALLGVAWAEMRTARRLARTWLFTILSLGVGVLAYLGLTVMQLMASSQSPSFGGFQPRFLVAGVGIFVLWLFMVGLVFLAFDIRARDRRERITEVLDTRPVSNLVLLTGRMAGIVATVWLPMVALFGLLQGFGVLAVGLELPFGDPLEPLSALAFVTVDALPMLILWCAIVFVLAVALRNRLLVVVFALALLGGHWLVVSSSPHYLLPAVSGFTGYTAFPSDVQPAFATATEIAQRVAELLLAGGLLMLAAILHPRPDRAAVGASWSVAGVLLAGGGLVIGTLAWRAMDAAALRDAWRAAHEARQDAPRADVARIEGSVMIDPGRGLELDLGYQLVAPDEPLDELVLSFNPGMAVTGFAVNGEPVPHTQSRGLLVAQLPTRAKPSERIALAVSARGVPDATFGYMDSALDVPALTSGAGNLLLLGTQTGVFDDAYVALMPAMGWLPMPGTLTGRDDPGRYARDHFTIDLEVRTPPEWLVAGPGLREGQAGEYRVRPGAPLPSLAPSSQSRFERRVVWMSLARASNCSCRREHRRNVEFFAEAEDAIRERLASMFEDARTASGWVIPTAASALSKSPPRLRAFRGRLADGIGAGDAGDRDAARVRLSVVALRVPIQERGTARRAHRWRGGCQGRRAHGLFRQRHHRGQPAPRCCQEPALVSDRCRGRRRVGPRCHAPRDGAQDVDEEPERLLLAVPVRDRSGPRCDDAAGIRGRCRRCRAWYRPVDRRTGARRRSTPGYGLGRGARRVACGSSTRAKTRDGRWTYSG